VFLTWIAAAAAAVCPPAPSPNGWLGGGPSGSPILNAFLSARADQPNYVNAGGTTFESQDGGSSWCALSRNIIGVSRTSPLALFAIQTNPGPGGATLDRSTDDGTTWTPAGQGLGSAQVESLAVDPIQPLRLAAAAPSDTGSGVAALFESNDGGASWTRLSHGLPVQSIPVLAWVPDSRPGASSALLAGTGSGLYRTDDEGMSWRSVAGPSGVSSFDVIGERAQAHVLVDQIGYQLFLSGDGGRSFSPLTIAGTYLPSACFGPLSVAGVPAIVAVSDGKLIRSTDLGATWTTVLTSFPTLETIVADPVDHRVLLAGSSYPYGPYRSTDGGVTWSDVSRGIDLSTVIAMAPSPTDSGVIFAQLEEAGLRKSTDGGLSWFDPSGGAPGGLGVSELFGSAIAASSGSSGTVLMGGDDSGRLSTFRSGDGGVTWATVTGGMPIAVVFDPEDPGHVVAGFSDFDRSNPYLAESHDGGATWTRYSGSTQAVLLEFDPAAPTVLRGVISFDQTSFALGRSTDAGRSWSTAPLPDDSIQSAAVAFDPTDASTVYVATFVAPEIGHEVTGIKKSTDGGRTWAALGGGLASLTPGTWIGQIAVDPTDRRHVVALAHGILYFEGTSYGSLYESNDAGETWASATPDVAPAPIGPIAFGTDGRLYASLWGAGVYFRNPSRRGVGPPSSQAPRPPISGRR
jgi:photosystem II stability/assembly factor-like uncharacterized protein